MQIRTVLERVGNDLSLLTVGRRVIHAACSVIRINPSALFTATLLVTAAFTVADNANGDQLQELAKKAGMKILSEGESSGDSQRKTVAAVPYNQMTAVNRQRAQKIIDGCTQYRKLPTLQYTIDAPIYRYLLSHPDVAVSTWRVMGISRFEMWQTGPTEYEAKAVDGTEGVADILYQYANQMLFVCEGNYHNVLLPRPLEASALIWFRANYAPNAEGTHVVTQKADVFVKFPSAGLSTVAKMLTPVTNSMMDRNLFEVSLYSSMMSRAVRDEPEWVIQVADQMEGVLPQRKTELRDIARLPRRTSNGDVSRAGVPMSVDRSVIMSPDLLFFDPPSDGKPTAAPPANGAGGAIRTAELSTKPATGNVRSVSSSAEMTGPAKTSTQESTKSQSDDEFELQPAVPPAGSTATDPAGVGPTSTDRK